MQYLIHTDGGARGNPGPAAIGVVVERIGTASSEKKATVAEFGKKIGETTNNVAEYSAVVEALSYLLSAGMCNERVQFLLDSTLVVNQLNGLFKVREPHLRILLLKVRQLESLVGGEIRYAAIPREENMRADYFVNKALDE